MKELRRKVLLPVFQLSQLADQSEPHALKRTINIGHGHPAFTYWYRVSQGNSTNRPFSYNLFPVVLDRKSAPWAPATLFILSQLEATTYPVMSTFHSRADDLGAFKEWLDTQDDPEQQLYYFPESKLQRTTYRFRGFLQQQIRAREIGASTAKRRMGAVISFYRWLILNKFFSTQFPTWEEKVVRLSLIRSNGTELSKTVKTTDLRIQAPKNQNDFDKSIFDGGKLRPLNAKEQDWLIEAAEAKGNTECLLIQLFMLGTGARIASACTLRLGHFTNPTPYYSKGLTGEGEIFRLKAGPGTGIETKNNKLGTFQIPRPLYELLHKYAHSDRAKLRRTRYLKTNAMQLESYLFLTQQGTPYYVTKEENQSFDPGFNKRYLKVGQPIRQFINDHAIPYVRQKYDKDFVYRPHDLRASFGMNMTEIFDKLIGAGKVSRHTARMIVKDLMWHESAETTDKYFKYKTEIDVFYSAINDYGKHLEGWTDRAMKGLSVDE